jgi:hypothetical protein
MGLQALAKHQSLKQIDQKRSTVYTSSRYSLCLLNNPHTKCSKTFGNIRVGIYKIRLVSPVYVRVAHLFSFFGVVVVCVFTF